MGGSPSTLFSQPWRTMPNNNQQNLEFMNSYKPRKSGVRHLRILLHGPVGAGKSSFINSVDTVLQNRVTNRASTDVNFGSSHTKQYKTYKIHKARGSSYSFIFNDIMGYEENMNNGVCVEDIKLALAGHVKDGYKFNPARPMETNDRYYNAYPTLDDRVHVLVSVFPADTVSLSDEAVKEMRKSAFLRWYLDSVSYISDNVAKKMREVREAAVDLGIPQLTILTKVDKACPEVHKDINNTYRSIRLKKKVDEISVSMGIQPNCILLLKNYESEDPNEGLNTLILLALRQIINTGEDFLNKK